MPPNDDDFDWDKYAEMDPIIEMMQAGGWVPPSPGDDKGLQAAREHYIDLNWADRMPQQWTREHEEQLPVPLQHKS